MKLHHSAYLAVTLLCLGGLAGCAQSNTNSTYTASAIGQPAAVVYGTIVGMRTVQMTSDDNTAGTLVGAAAGGLAGSFIGGGTRMNLLGALGGAVLGGVAGNMAQNEISKGTATQFFIKREDGQIISLVQKTDEPFYVGERVLITYGNEVRIVPAAVAYGVASSG